MLIFTHSTTSSCDSEFDKPTNSSRNTNADQEREKDRRRPVKHASCSELPQRGNVRQRLRASKSNVSSEVGKDGSQYSQFPHRRRNYQQTVRNDQFPDCISTDGGGDIEATKNVKRYDQFPFPTRKKSTHHHPKEIIDNCDIIGGTRKKVKSSCIDEPEQLHKLVYESKKIGALVKKCAREKSQLKRDYSFLLLLASILIIFKLLIQYWIGDGHGFMILSEEVKLTLASYLKETERWEYFYSSWLGTGIKIASAAVLGNIGLREDDDQIENEFAPS